MDNIKIRKALKNDIGELISLDEIARSDPNRAAFINDWVKNGECYIAKLSNNIVGYAVLNDRFFINPI